MPANVRKEIKEEMLAKIKGGAKASEIADQYGVTRRSVFGWLSGESTTKCECHRVSESKTGTRWIISSGRRVGIRTASRGEK